TISRLDQTPPVLVHWTKNTLIFFRKGSRHHAAPFTHASTRRRPARARRVSRHRDARVLALGQPVAPHVLHARARTGAPPAPPARARGDADRARAHGERGASARACHARRASARAE